ncbi:inositol monophosphatase [Roseovarius faecimaris]|uniref:Inositol monophosphatase n=1 Tax=Roseovarius faecimaris TaxID=2494550 RepID=A0A6I6IUN4_9RHOB|nr:inositol monophosphatase family protein [Roseovarius faecimaris]QGX99764.1 inositol monophosphatase [Roseovarius faecimaris]
MVRAVTLEEHAEQIAKFASEMSREFFRRPLDVDFKSDESPVTQADRAVENAVRDYLRKHLPDHGIFGEEHGVEGEERRHMWVVDPIDGTRSFLSGHPLYGFLLAYLVDGTPRLGVIAMPALNEVLIGTLGQGATLNGEPIAVSAQTQLNDAILYINEGEKIYREHGGVFERLIQSGRTRRFSYDCYPHALLAAGHVDVVVDYDLQPYDILAVSAVVEAAGGIVTDWQGQPLSQGYSGAIVSACTPELHRSILDVLSG